MRTALQAVSACIWGSLGANVAAQCHMGTYPRREDVYIYTCSYLQISYPLLACRILTRVPNLEEHETPRFKTRKYVENAQSAEAHIN